MTRLSGNVHGYLASGTFIGLGLQSAGAWPQHSPAAHSANNTDVEFISSSLTLQVYLYHTDAGLSIRVSEQSRNVRFPTKYLASPIRRNRARTVLPFPSSQCALASRPGAVKAAVQCAEGQP